MNRKVKRILASVLSVGALVCSSAAIKLQMDIVKANETAGELAYNQSLVTKLTMEKGAQVRLGATDAQKGIRFLTKMTNTDYTNLMAEVGTEEDKYYSEVSFGMVIVPRTYLTTGFELTEENVFGSSAVFDSTITENTTTKRMIIDMPSPDLYDYDTSDSDTDLYFNGAIVGIKSENTAMEFVGRGYVKYKVNGSNDYQYTFASYYEDDIDNNSRSMAYVAQKALEDPDYNTNTTLVSYLNGYLNNVTDVASDYTIKYHLLDEESGEYIEKEKTVTSTINATVDFSSDTNAVDGYIPDTDKNTTTKYTVYANNRLVIDRYYKEFTPYSITDGVKISKVETAEETGDEIGTYKVQTNNGWQKKAITFIQNGNYDQTTITTSNAKYISIQIKLASSLSEGRIKMYTYSNETTNDASVSNTYCSADWYIGSAKTGSGVRSSDSATLFEVFDLSGKKVTSLVTGTWYEFVIPVLENAKGYYYQHLCLTIDSSISDYTTVAYFKDVKLLETASSAMFTLEKTAYEMRSFQSAAITLAEGSSNTLADLTFTSDDETVAKVVDGRIVAQGTPAAGKSTTITVSNGIISREISVTVKSDVTTNSTYGSTVEYVSEGDFEGSYKYTDNTGGSTGYINADGGTTKVYGENGVYFDGVATTAHRPETEFFETYKYLKFDFYMSDNTAAINVRRAVYSTSDSSTTLFTTLTLKPNDTLSSNGTIYYILNESGAKAIKLLSKTWYTIYVPMDKGENTIDYTKWSCVTLYTNSTSTVTTDKANAAIMYLKNISFETAVSADDLAEITDYNLYSVSWQAEKVVEDGEEAYKITTTDGWAAKGVVFSDTSSNNYDYSEMFSGKNYVSMKIKFGSKLKSIRLCNSDKTPFDSTDTSYVWSVGSTYAGNCITIYDDNGNDVTSTTKLATGVWYNFVIKIPDTVKAGTDNMYFYIIAGSDVTGEVWYKDVELCATDPYVSAFVYAPTATSLSTEVQNTYTTYYFDSVSGNDQNSGELESSPLSSLSKAKELIATATESNPIKILFKAGSAYAEPFEISGFAATEEKPLIIGVYGQSSDAQYVSFTCNGTDSYACVKITAGNVRISGFECYSVSGRYGILVSPTAAGAMSNIVIEECYIHDVNFNTTGITLPTDGSVPDETTAQAICSDSNYQHSYGGIVFTAATSESVGASWFENVWIRDNLIERVSRSGIWISSMWVQRPGLDWGYNHYYDDDTNWYPQKNINVVGNRVEYAGGDGIVLIATVGGYIESNVCYHAQYLGRTGYYNVGIWTHSCDNVVFQFNEAAYTHGTLDGQGFDIDIGCTNITFRYNYSHHNEGGGILFCNTMTNLTKYDENGDEVLNEDGNAIVEFVGPEWGNNIIANNVFADNGSCLIKVNGYCKTFTFANNTCIVTGESEYIVNTDGKYATTTYPGGNKNYITGDEWQFINNIFYTREKIAAKFYPQFCMVANYDHNVFYNFESVSFEVWSTTTTVTNSVYDVDPEFAELSAELGYENSYIFVPAETLLTGAVWIEGLTDCDYLGRVCKNDTYYYGAFGS